MGSRLGAARYQSDDSECEYHFQDLAERAFVIFMLPPDTTGGASVEMEWVKAHHLGKTVFIMPKKQPFHATKKSLTTLGWERYWSDASAVAHSFGISLPAYHARGGLFQIN